MDPLDDFSPDTDLRMLALTNAHDEGEMNGKRDERKRIVNKIKGLRKEYEGSKDFNNLQADEVVSMILRRIS